MPAVWPVSLAPPVRRRLRFANLHLDLGDGYRQSLNKNQARSSANGLGAVASHKGMWEFEVTGDHIKFANADTSKETNKLIQLAYDTNGFSTAFYFYWPEEAAIDPAGTATTGRYLVYSRDPMDLENVFNKLSNFKLTLIETRA